MKDIDRIVELLLNNSDFINKVSRGVIQKKKSKVNKDKSNRFTLQEIYTQFKEVPLKKLAPIFVDLMMLNPVDDDYYSIGSFLKSIKKHDFYLDNIRYNTRCINAIYVAILSTFDFLEPDEDCNEFGFLYYTLERRNVKNTRCFNISKLSMYKRVVSYEPETFRNILKNHREDNKEKLEKDIKYLIKKYDFEDFRLSNFLDIFTFVTEEDFTKILRIIDDV